ncbi:E3 ubiquitin-protein ligase EL5 [Hordeum vulgare]|uniref:RING-type E3 ubiquitin transferase n=2 Tax=Hordeum vulgare subsp. vulgare TaxID=112509 RepID=A0A8I6WV72_HORVV|nr:E3 ubiquitin-protein ligase EL5-like [Hordeum vulgare subsp. vulgare]KAE8772350.1 E3 ubiquitin-protein ligase EL5 [Hordeum vulgare]KAI5015055.1 hypothetical protein ZWY2020_056445 [Hordeum vulgare]KAI5015061.1 hypothetical protein ZWY2020_056451 [Hordeum vulgare]
MSSLPGDDAGRVLPSEQAPTTAVDGDVIFSAVAVLFLGLALAFVLYHYLTVSRRGVRDGTGTERGSPSLRVGAASASGVAQGVDPVVLRALPVTLYRAKDFADALECAVCLAELSDGEAARFLPKCGHGFHAECVDLWLHSHPTCPLCRVDVDKPDALPLTLPPVRHEPANYTTNLPTNVLFWGSPDPVTTGRTLGGPSSSGGAAAAIVIEVPEATESELAPRDGDAGKSQGLARVRSIKRLWSRGIREVGASSSASSCHPATGRAHTDGTLGVAARNFDP